MDEFGKVIFPQGEYVGEVVNGKAHGYGRITFNNGDIYMGQWSNNCMTGVGAIDKKSHVTLGHFLNGKRHGNCLTIYKRGSYDYDFYIGQYVNDLKCGTGAYYWQNEDCYYGQFANDRSNGKGYISRFGGNSFFGGTYKDTKCIDDGIDYPKTKLSSGYTFYGDCNQHGFYHGFGLLVSPQVKVRDLGYHNRLGPNMRISYNFKGVRIGGNRIRCGSLSKYLEVGDWGTSGRKNGKFDKIYKDGMMYSGDYVDGKRCGYGIYYDGTIISGCKGSIYIGRFSNGKLVDGVEVGRSFLVLGKGKFSDGVIKDGYRLYNTNELVLGASSGSQFIELPVFNGVLNMGASSYSIVNNGVSTNSTINNKVYDNVQKSYDDYDDDFEPKRYRYDGRNNPLLHKEEVIEEEEEEDITGTLKDPEYLKKLEKHAEEKRRIDKHYELIAKIENLYITKDYSKTIVRCRYDKIDKNHEIPEFISKIGHKAFYLNATLETLVAPSTLETIEEDAFRNCTNLKEVDLSKTKVKSIDNKIFVGCKNLEVLKLPKCIETVLKSSFKDCEKLKKVIVSSDEFTFEEFINKYAKDEKISKYYYFDDFEYYKLGSPFNYLQNDNGLYRLIEVTTGTKEDIIIPNNIELICNNAFKTVKKYVKKIIPLCKNINFEKAALKGCINLFELDLSETILVDMPKIDFSDCKKLDTLRLPDTFNLLSVENIFNEIHSLTKIYFKNKVLSSRLLKEEINKLKNTDEYKLKQNTEEENRKKEIESKYKWVEKKISSILSSREFRNDKFLRGINLSKCFDNIHEDTFSDCDALEEVILPKRDMVIFKNAFKNCKKLRKITISLEYNTKINSFAFSGCSSLKEIKLKATCIENYAFDNCHLLENIYIDQSSKKCVIEPKAFYTCTNLKEFYAPSVKDLDSNTFIDCTKINKIVVHKKCKIEKLVFKNKKKINIVKEGKTKILTIE